MLTANDTKLAFSVDTARVTALGNGVYQAFVQITSTEPKYWNQDHGRPYQRMVQQAEFNCGTFGFRSTADVAYGKTGNVVGNESTPAATWSTAMPGSYVETVLRDFCSIAGSHFAMRGASAPAPLAPIDPRWLAVGNNAAITVRADTTRLSRTDSGYVHLFERSDYSTPQRTVTVPISEYAYAIGEALYDCSQLRRRYLTFAGYSSNGTVVFNEAGAPAWLTANPQSVLEASIRAVCARPAVSATSVVSSATATGPTGPHIEKTGSAFPVSRVGFLLTNNHVIEGCDAVQLQLGNSRFARADVVVADETNDIALLRTEHHFASAAALRGGTPLRPGDDVVAVGFPLAGLLADQPNVTVGTVSALAGPGDDSRYVQITAPVQPGNSGGPLFDASGHLVGIVSAKLDAATTIKAAGAMPENVNFAINGSVIRAFLDGHSVRYTVARSDSTFSNGTIGERGRDMTVRVNCIVAK
jgi:S1-C subfamily serine protease